MNEALVQVSKAGAAATIMMNRPDRLNTMTASFLDALLDAVESVAADPEIRVAVLRGAGRAFCAGGDLKEGVGGGVGGEPPLDSQVRRLRTYMRVSQVLRSMPAVTIAAVQGACAGAGLSLACACDLRVAQLDAKFATAFLTAGLSGDFGGTWLLPRIVGGGRARDLYFRSTPFGAEHALAIGLVGSIHEDVAAAADEMVAELLARPPLAIAKMKANLNDAEDLTFSELLDREAARHSACVATEDGAEATAAFLEKRVPVFHGR